MGFSKIIRPFFVVILLLLYGFQSTDVDCTRLKTGRFHAYNRESGNHFIILRKDSLQFEINSLTQDTAVWKIQWISPCSFTARYVSGSGPKNEAEKQIYQSAVITYEINTLTPQYYTGHVRIKASNGNSSYSDTTWLQER